MFTKCWGAGESTSDRVQQVRVAEVAECLLSSSARGGYSTTNGISEEWVPRCATHTPVIQRTYYTNASLAVQQLSLHAFLEKQEFYKPPL